MGIDGETFCQKSVETGCIIAGTFEDSDAHIDVYASIDNKIMLI